MRIFLITTFVLTLFAGSAVADPYSKEVRDAFMGECVRSGGDEAMCGCVLAKMEANITEDDLAKENFTEEQLIDYTRACMQGDTPADQYPPEVRDAFMGECTKGGATEKVCTCVLTKMEANISMEQLAAQDFEQQTIVDLTMECMK